MARKTKDPEASFIEQALADLEVNLTSIKNYLDSNDWLTEEDEAKQKREFKFQADLFDKYQSWLKEYMNLSGIMDFYKESKREDKNELRKGYEESGLMSMLEDDKLDD